MLDVTRGVFLWNETVSTPSFKERKGKGELILGDWVGYTPNYRIVATWLTLMLSVTLNIALNNIKKRPIDD